jgi:5'-nucleotidase/UDP-sugar diphosphatase
VSNPTEAVKKVMADLQGKADVFIVLSNLGFAEDNQLAADVPGIAVIIGGRSSTILAEPFRDSTTRTLVTQAGFQGEWIGELKVNFDTQGKSTTYKGAAVVLSADFPDDPAIRAWLDTIPK